MSLDLLWSVTTDILTSVWAMVGTLCGFIVALIVYEFVFNLFIYDVFSPRQQETFREADHGDAVDQLIFKGRS